MAVHVILKTIISVFAIGVGLAVFMPVMWELYYNSDLWTNAPPEAIETRENVYGLFMMMPILMIGAVILWAYLSSTRKDSSF